jgi:hypothetical protein
MLYLRRAVQVRELCAYVEKAHGMAAGWLLSVPQARVSELCTSPLQRAGLLLPQHPQAMPAQAGQRSCARSDVCLTHGCCPLLAGLHVRVSAAACGGAGCCGGPQTGLPSDGTGRYAPGALIEGDTRPEYAVVAVPIPQSSLQHHTAHCACGPSRPCFCSSVTPAQPCCDASYAAVKGDAGGTR